MPSIEDEIAKELGDYVDELRSKMPEEVGVSPRKSFLDVAGAARDQQLELDELEAARFKLTEIREEVVKAINLLDVRVDALKASLKVYYK